MAAERQPWQTLAKAKLDSINESIPADWRLPSLPRNEERRDVTGDYVRQFLSKEEIEVTEAIAPAIVESTSTGHWTAEIVARAFCHRASLAHQLTNCLHDTFFDAAIEDAKSLDAYITKNRKPKGPLHGLPVSLKDQFHVKGVETTMGYVGWLGTFQGKKGTGKERVFESEMVQELRDLGAVLYCKTSVPHTLMTGETVNNIIGYTWNPKNRNLSCGGSSGGEGALIGLRGSPAGFGTDIGGSIRIPAAFNGLYGLRPSAGRLPYQGMAKLHGWTKFGVVSSRANSTSLLSREPWLHDPLVHDIPWRDEKAVISKDQKLFFAVLRHDGVVSLHPPVKRALETVTERLEKQGHRIIEWKPPDHQRGVDTIIAAWKYDNGADVRSAFELSGEPMAPQIASIYGAELHAGPPKDATFIAANNVARREYQKEYMEYWNSTAELTGTGKPVDIVIAPVAPVAAARPNGVPWYGYSGIVNALDYTACTLPVTTVDKSIDVLDPSFQPLGDLDKSIMDQYDPEIYDGAHVGLQLIGRRLQEEKVLAVTEYVAGVLTA
ncbi:MAG: hypothetical protein L6R36_004199 [Xanthoria steineri]|nr:MAG: hypothetical protein L6R36_004199 [Xanthoria steineri]